MNKYTVACVLRSGGIYDAGWVARLKKGIERNAKNVSRFVCLSDLEVDCERIPLVTLWPGWWSKIELFRPGLFTGPVLYLDLDTIVVGSVDRLMEHPHRFTAAHEFYRHKQLCSTAMAWNGEFGIFEDFSKRPEFYQQYYDSRVSRRNGFIGDQAYIERYLVDYRIPFEFFRDTAGPQSVASFKVDNCEQAPALGASIVAFHGKPKPHQINSGWVKDAWTLH